MIQAGLINGPADFVMAADAALRHQRITHDELICAVELFAGHPGIGAIRAAVGAVHPGHASPGESRAGLSFHRLGIAVTPQFEVKTPKGRRFADFKVDGEPVIVEVDGRVKYEQPWQRPDGADDVVWLEKQRQDLFYDQLLETVRLTTWGDLGDLRTIEVRISQATQRGRIRWETERQRRQAP